MIITKPGKIIKDLYMVGNAGVPVYLVDGDVPAIFDAGYAIFGRMYVKEIKKILGVRQPEFCFLSHSHFDHCGSVSILKDSFPSLKVICSEKAKNIFTRPNAIKTIRELGRSAEPVAENCGIDFSSDDLFEPFEVDQTVKDGDILNISDTLSIRAIETPGHTRDCISYYIPKKKILFSSEALGIANQAGHIYTSFLIDYDMYYNSMKKLSALELEAICLGHNMALTGKDAGSYIQNSMLQCANFLQLIETCVAEEKGDLDKIKKRIKKIEYDGQTGMVQPEPAYLLNLEASIKVIIKRMEKNI